MRRRIAMLTLITVGAVLIAGTLALQMFSRAPAFETMTSDFSRNVTPATVAVLRTDVADLRAGGEELTTKGIPALAQLLGMTPAQFAATAQTQFPALALGVQQIPVTAATFDRLLSVIAAQDGHLKSAVAIPTKGIKTAVLPWLIIAAGIGAIGLGFIASRRSAQLVALTLGAVMLVGVFAFAIPSKASDADALNKAMKPFFTQQQIDGARQSMTALNATSQELISKVLPAIATAQHVPAIQLQTQFAGQFPALTKAVISLPDATERFGNLAATFQRNLANFKKVEPFHFAGATWGLVVAGLLVMIGGAIPLVWAEESAAGERAHRRFHRAA